MRGIAVNQAISRIFAKISDRFRHMGCLSLKIVVISIYMGKDNRKRNNKKRLNDGYEPQGDAAALSTPLEAMGLSEKTEGILRDGGVAIAKDLAKRRAGDLYRIRYVGKRECIEVSNALKKLGLSFRPDEPKVESPDVQNVKKPQEKERRQEENKSKNQADKNNLKKQQNEKNVQNKASERNNKQSAPVQNKNQKNKQEKPQEKNSRPKYDYKPYDNVNLHDLVFGKRERPAPEKPQKEQLTPDSIVKFCRQGKWGYKDWKGNVLIQPVYDNAYPFREDRACVEKDGLLGFIDKKNELIIDYKYDSATSFAEGLAAVSIGEKTGYIDKDGAEVLPMEFDVATAFENGKAIVRQDGRWGVLDRETLKVLWR